jgi:hypothetical protein
LIEDLIEEPHTFIGEVVVGGRSVDAWTTLHGRLAPALLSSEGLAKTCPVCGDVYSTIHGRAFFANPTARSMPLIVNRNGIFIRRDVFEKRRLPTPAGAFKPSWVGLEEQPN